MESSYHTCKVTDVTLRYLRIIAAHTGEHHYAVVERLMEAEWRRMQAEWHRLSAPVAPAPEGAPTTKETTT